MKIAQQLKEKNIAEYLIYMWQVEDLLRANGCDIDRIRQNIILRYPEEERPALEEWYGNLADMMRAEGVTEKGQGAGMPVRGWLRAVAGLSGRSFLHR